MPKVTAADEPWKIGELTEVVTARVPVKLAVLLIVWELIVLEVLMVDIPDSAPELIIRPLIVLVAVAPVIAPDKPMVEIPDSAPALLTSKLVELIVKGELPPPIYMLPVLVPVLMLVSKLELALSEVAAPYIVAPAVAVSKELKVLAPARVWVPVVTTPPKEALAGSRLSCWPVKVIPLALAEDPIAAIVTALWTLLLGA